MATPEKYSEHATATRPWAHHLKKLLVLGWLLIAFQAQAQMVVTIPLAEQQAKKQALHQGFLTTLKALGNRIAKEGNVAQAAIKKLNGETVGLHEDWYNSLLKINVVVQDYQRVKTIWSYQSRTMSLYTQNISLLRQNPYLAPAQLQAMVHGYTVLLSDNANLLDELTTILTPSAAKMTDAQRLKFINRIADKVEHQYALTAYFTRRNQALASRQRQEVQEALQLKQLYGLSK